MVLLVRLMMVSCRMTLYTSYGVVMLQLMMNEEGLMMAMISEVSCEMVLNVEVKVVVRMMVVMIMVMVVVMEMVMQQPIRQ
ncbi:hypothetical protein Tco_0211174 [Tanacetum coccineum]